MPAFVSRTIACAPHTFPEVLMACYVADGWLRPHRKFTDPDAFLACDNSRCDAPWVMADALVSWSHGKTLSQPGLFADRFLIGCNATCLQAAQVEHPDMEWSQPAPVGQWLDALRASLSVDPRTTPIGELAMSAAD